MNVAVIKDSIAQMTLDERREVSAFISHLNSVQDPEFMAELGRRMDQMQAGQETGEEQLEALHRRLQAS